MQSKAKTVAEYLAELPEERRAALDRLRKLVRKIAPKAVEGMQYGMPFYQLDGEPLVAFAAQKNYLAIYVGDCHLVEAHRARLKGADCGGVACPRLCVDMR